MKMKKNFRLWMLMMPVAFGLASCENGYDRPIDPKDVINPETPEQQAFWQKFDAWQTDSCTVGDDFYMHMIGTWRKNPVAVYPNGLTEYAEKLNDSRVEQIRQKNENLQLLKKHIDAYMTIGTVEVSKLVKAKVDELWAGATTREEALAALGRAWAEGYTTLFEPIVTLVKGVPTWQLTLKMPSYVSVDEVFGKKEQMWEKMAPHKSARMRMRGAQGLTADLSIVTKAMNIGVDCIEVDEGVLESITDAFATAWKSVDDIKEEIEKSVVMMDGVLVNDECVDNYNDYLAYFLKSQGVDKKITLNRNKILQFVQTNMGDLYALNDYNRYYITPKARQQYTDWCEEFRSVMRQRLETNTWLEATTRQNALNKLDKVVFFVGSMSVIPDCVVSTLTGKNIIEDLRQLRQMRMEGFRWSVKQPRSICAALLHMLTYYFEQTIDNATYVPALNIVNINPSNLCEPYVQDDYDDVLQQAFIGTTIGHELTHAFDRSGSKFDEWGHYNNWWAPNDTVKFATLCDKLEDQYNKLQLMPWVNPEVCGDGEKTLSENIADLGGCCIALQNLLSKHANATDAEKRQLTRRFFQGWAIQWSSVYGLFYVYTAKNMDNHSLGRERTNGVVRNVDEWYDAYDVKSGTLFLPPSERVHIW